MVLLIIIPIKWLFHWEYSLFQTYPYIELGPQVAAAVLSDRYISDRFLPDKAIDLMDEASAKARQWMLMVYISLYFDT